MYNFTRQAICIKVIAFGTVKKFYCGTICKPGLFNTILFYLFFIFHFLCFYNHLTGIFTFK
jgi:hypothetical protein